MPKLRTLLSLIVTIVILATPISNWLKLILFLLSWYVLLRPMRERESWGVLFAIAVIFTVQDALAVAQGVFRFKTPDYLGLPVWEMALWPYWLIITQRLVGTRNIPAMKLLPVVFAVLFSAPFHYFASDPVTLTWTVSLVLLAMLGLFRRPQDLYFALVMILIGTAVEWTGVRFNQWDYPHPQIAGLTWWFIPMWGGIGLLYRNLALPLTQPGVNIRGPAIFFKFLTRESLKSGELPRQIEKNLVMRGRDVINSYHRAGDLDHELTPIHQYNARNISRLAPEGARVLDLGAASGQFLRYLSLCRTDLNLTGVEASEEMVAKFQEVGIGRSHCRLIQADMRDLGFLAGEKFDVIFSTFTLHHLPTLDDVRRAFVEIKRLAGDQANIYIFDNARPQFATTVDDFLDTFLRGTEPLFLADTYNSIRGSFRFSEIKDIFAEVFDGGAISQTVNRASVYQLHYVVQKDANADHDRLFSPPRLNFRSRFRAWLLGIMLGKMKIPGTK